ncbi:MAG: glycoside hydrolase family 2 protein [Bacilli bacterium]
MKICLNEGWTLTGGAIREPLSAVVPTSVYYELLRRGMIADPYYGDNDRAFLALMEEDYTYRKRFFIDEEQLKKTINLVFLGIDTISEIFLNGLLIERTFNMHRRYRIRVNGYLKQGENELKVVLKSPLRFMNAEAERTSYRLMQMQATVKNYPYIRKAHSVFGWDWGPQLPDAGIWRDVYLEITDAGRIKDVAVFQRTTPGKALVTVKVENELFKPCRLVLRLSRRGKTINETALPARALNEITFAVENPDLWYPAGYGEPALYRLETALFAGEEEVSREELSVGFRDIRIIREADEHGESFKFNVNGVDIFAKGANYIIEDNLMPRYSRARTEELIKAALFANFNMLRVWGGGIYPHDYFYDLCDEHGILVWQDLMFACAYYDMENERFREETAAEVADNVKRLRNHPSLAVICGNNENETAITWNPPDPEEARRQYLYQYEEFIPRLLTEVAPDVFYWPSSPSSGGGFEDPNGPSRGDVHDWRVWHGMRPAAAYREIVPRFLSEFGMQSLPCEKTLTAFTKKEDFNLFNYIFDHRQRAPQGNARIIYYIGEFFRFPRDFSSLVYLSQVMQAETVRIAVEHLRRNRSRAMGSLYWQLNDCWPTISWSSVDYFGRYKALHYRARHFYNPVLLTFAVNGEKQEAELYIANDLTQPLAGTYRWALIGLKGEVIREEQGRFSVAASSPSKIATIKTALSHDELKNAVLVAGAVDDAGNIYECDAAFVPDKYLALVKPRFELALKQEAGLYRLTIESDAVAKFLEISVSGTDVVFSDNYFFLRPGEKKTVTWHSDKTITLDDLALRSLVDAY